jgi:hypothetical protein
MAMILFDVVGEDDPHKDPAPFKIYLIFAADEVTARSFAPSAFRVDRVDCRKIFPDLVAPPARLGWVGGAYPLLSMP